METIVILLIFVMVLAGLSYRLNLINIRVVLCRKRKEKIKRWRFYSITNGDNFLIVNDKNVAVFSFDIASLERIMLSKKDTYSYDTILVHFKNKEKEIVISEDEVDTTKLFDDLKIFLGKEHLYIDVMTILQKDVVILWKSQK